MIDVEKFAFLTLELGVFHRILRHSKDEKLDPILSEKIIRFDGENQDKSKFLKAELLKVIHNKGISISFSGNPRTDSPSIIKEIFLKLDDPSIKEDAKGKLFLEKSKLFAERLNNFHKLTMPGGILAILYGTIEISSETDKNEKILLKNDAPKKQILIIAKIEEEKGLQVVTEQIENEANVNLDIQIVENLIRLHKANVMKAGVFYND
jgi:hypothetical protein